jgi:hypothetical protein
VPLFTVALFKIVFMAQPNKQQIIDGLNEQVATLQQKLTAATEGTLVEQLQEENRNVKEELENERAQHATVKEQLDVANAQVAELEKAVEALAAGDGSKATSTTSAAAVKFEHGGEVFAIAKKVSIPKLGVFTPEQVAQSEDAQEWLVKNNSPFITRQSGIERK